MQLSLLAMMDGSTGFTTEPCVNWVSDLRLQKIGGHYRAIRRFKTWQGDVSWKANDAFGIGEEDVPMEARWRDWCDVAARVLDMELLGLDLLVNAEGREYVLECNSSSIGFPERHRTEDVGHIVELLNGKIANAAKRLTTERIKRELLKQSVSLVSGRKTTAVVEELRALFIHRKQVGEWNTKILLPKSNLAASAQVKSALVLLVAQCFRQQHAPTAADGHMVAAIVHAALADIAASHSQDAFLLENTLQLTASELKLVQ
jgi:hypothetical protein